MSKVVKSLLCSSVSKTPWSWFGERWNRRTGYLSQQIHNSKYLTRFLMTK